jgi:hypothetical protein
MVFTFLFFRLCKERKSTGNVARSRRGRREELSTQKNIRLARCWWLTPVILVTQEADIRRIEV